MSEITVDQKSETLTSEQRAANRKAGQAVLFGTGMLFLAIGCIMLVNEILLYALPNFALAFTLGFVVSLALLGSLSMHGLVCNGHSIEQAWKRSTLLICLLSAGTAMLGFTTVGSFSLLGDGWAVLALLCLLLLAAFGLQGYLKEQ